MSRKIDINAKDYDETLAWVNAYRLAHGKGLVYELPSGLAGSPNSCPLANATGREISEDTPMPQAARRLYNVIDDVGGYHERVKPVRRS
jgi:hypothetical protein